MAIGAHPFPAGSTVALAALLSACNVDTRPPMSAEQFAALARNCQLPDRIVIQTENRDLPLIDLSDAEPTVTQIECIRSEQDRIGAIADMAN